MGENNSSLRDEVSQIHAKVDYNTDRLTRMDAKIDTLVERTIRLDERFPQQSKKTVFSLSTVSAVITTVVLTALNHFGIKL